MAYDKEKFLALASDRTSDWLQKAQWRLENEDWLDLSAQIAMRILRALRHQNLTQRDLADRLGVSPQQVSKIVKGKENLTLETITKIEKALDINLLHVIREKEDAAAKAAQYSFSDYIKFRNYGGVAFFEPIQNRGETADAATLPTPQSPNIISMTSQSQPRVYGIA